MRRFLAGLAVAASLVAPAAQAAVTYTFTGMQTMDFPVDPEDPDSPRTQAPITTSFTLTRSTFITNGFFVADTCSAGHPFLACRDVEFDNFENQFDVQGDFLAFGHLYDDGFSTGGGSAFYFFQPGAFGAVGTYTTAGWPVDGPGCCVGNAGFATLTVSGVAEAIPEPGAWALMIMGFGGVGAMLRRRRQTDTCAAA